MDGTLLAAGAGVALALALLVSALFLDPIMRLSRSTALAVSRAARRALAPLTAERRQSRQTQLEERRGAAPLALVRGLAARLADRLQRLRARTGPELGPEQSIRSLEEPVSDEGDDLDEWAAETRPRHEALPRREGVGRQRLFRPASSLHVEDALARYFERRHHSAPIEAFVRYLDGQFGPGRGVGVLEGLRRRGVVTVRRDPKVPTRLTVSLSGDPASPEPT